MNAACATPSSWSFGDSPALADDLLALVLAGRKTATCGAVQQYEAEGMPKPGERSVVLDGAGVPACVIETTSVDIRRFDEVDAEFARDEGEGDLSYEFWRAAHEAYFRRTGDFSPDMQLVCERFRLVEILPRDSEP
jgi:uncharacterized protein YhfF